MPGIESRVVSRLAGTSDTPFGYRLLDGDDYLTIMLFGPVSKDDAKHVLDAITQDGTIRHPRRLWDLRGCEFRLNSDELMELASIARSRDPEQGRGAVLVGEDLTFGLLRIYQAFRESDSNDVRVFRDEIEAIAWVQQ